MGPSIPSRACYAVTAAVCSRRLLALPLSTPYAAAFWLASPSPLPRPRRPLCPPYWMPCRRSTASRSPWASTPSRPSPTPSLRAMARAPSPRGNGTQAPTTPLARTVAGGEQRLAAGGGQGEERQRVREEWEETKTRGLYMGEGKETLIGFLELVWASAFFGGGPYIAIYRIIDIC